MERVIENKRFMMIKDDLRDYFGGMYGGNQHIGSKGIAKFGCGSVTLHTYVAYEARKRYTKDEVKELQEQFFKRYLLGPTTALRFKLAALAYYGLRKRKASVRIIHSLYKESDGLKKIMIEIRKNIEKDNPVPLIIGKRTMKGYKDELDNHWVTVTGYSDDYSVVVSNNGRMEELDLNELSHRRLFIAIAAINVK